MPTRSVLEDAFAHHAWATLEVLDACARLQPHGLDATAPGTYGSIIETLRHIVGADASYLYALTGGRVPSGDGSPMDLAGLREATQRHREAWTSLLARDLDPDEIVVRRRDDGSEGHAPLGIRLAQALHHGSDHRSQVCTILTTLGVEPPAIDVWDYAWSRGLFTEVPPPS